MNGPQAAPDLASWPTKQQAAETLQRSAKSIERLIAAGKIEARKRPQKGKSPTTVCNPDDVARLLPAAHVMPPAIQTKVPAAVRNSPENFPAPPALTDFAALLAFLANAAAAAAAGRTGPARRWLTLQEASGYCGLSERFLRRAISAGRLPAERDGRNWKIRREDLDKL